jgi:hypothetical protein
MNDHRRNTLAAGLALVAALWLLSSCNQTTLDAQAANSPGGRYSTSSHSVLSGTTIPVALSGNISSETANAGDAWHGNVTENVTAERGATIPAGSRVDGVVVGVTPAKRGSRAMLELGVRGIEVNGHRESIPASAEQVIAGSTRARNLGAIAGGAAAGALIGKVVGDGKNAAVGGLLGGAAAAGVVAGSKGYQVVLTDGTVMSFTVSRTVAMR